MRSTMRSPRCDTLMTASRNPAAASRSRCQPMSGLPPASTSAFGIVSVSGRSRSPRPAARSIAFTRARPAVWRAGRARRVLQVFRLAVAVIDAREDAQHLEVALQSHPLQRAPELAEIGPHRQARALRPFPIAHRPVEHALFLPADKRVAHQGYHVVG